MTDVRISTRGSLSYDTEDHAMWKATIEEGSGQLVYADGVGRNEGDRSSFSREIVRVDIT